MKSVAREDEPWNAMPHASAEAPLLSPREQEIIRLVAVGYPNKTIAGILEISPWTVATHVRRVFTKMGVHGRAAMIARLAQTGFCFDRRRGPNIRRGK